VGNFPSKRKDKREIFGRSEQKCRGLNKVSMLSVDKKNAETLIELRENSK